MLSFDCFRTTGSSETDRAWSAGTLPEKIACYEVLHVSLETTARVIAPFMPFVADALHQSLGSPHSVHLADWPVARPEWRDERLAAEMRAVRTIVRLARSIRERLRVKHRHPLAALYVGGVDDSILATHAGLLTQEVNVKTVDVLSDGAICQANAAAAHAGSWQAFGPWLAEQALAVELTTTEIDDVLAAGTARLAVGSVHVAIGRAAAETWDAAAQSGEVSPE